MKQFLHMLEKLWKLGDDTEISFSLRSCKSLPEYITFRMSTGDKRYATTVPIFHASRSRGGLTKTIEMEFEHAIKELQQLIDIEKKTR